MNKFTLEKIFNLYANDINFDEEITSLTSQLQTKLLNKLNDEERVLFNKYDDIKAEEIQVLSHEYFKQGFRASIMLMLEVLE